MQGLEHERSALRHDKLRKSQSQHLFIYVRERSRPLERAVARNREVVSMEKRFTGLFATGITYSVQKVPGNVSQLDILLVAPAGVLTTPFSHFHMGPSNDSIG